MSYTELYSVPEKGQLGLYAEFHNSHRGAGLVWSEMSNRYLGGFPIMGDMQPVWDLCKSSRVPLDYRIVMAATFDKVMVKRAKLPRLIQAIKEYAKCFDPGTLLQQVEKLQELADNPTCYAVCWNQTSVNCDAWAVERPGEVDEYGDPLWEMHDISRDTDHWFLFDDPRFADPP